MGSLSVMAPKLNSFEYSDGSALIHSEPAQMLIAQNLNSKHASSALLLAKTNLALRCVKRRPRPANVDHETNRKTSKPHALDVRNIGMWRAVSIGVLLGEIDGFPW